MANKIVLTIDNIKLVIAGHMNVCMYVLRCTLILYLNFLCIYKCSVGKDENYNNKKFKRVVIIVHDLVRIDTQ